MTRLHVLAEIAGSVLDAVGNESRLLGQVADAAGTALGGTASTWLLGPGDDRLEPAVVQHDAALVADMIDALRADAAGRERPSARMLAGEPVVVQAPAPPEAAAPESPEAPHPVAPVLGAHGLSGMVVLPMLVRDRLLGAIAVTRVAGRPAFDGADVELGMALAGVAGATLANARMVADSAAVVDELRRQSELMDHISDAMISCDPDWRIVSWNVGAERTYGYPRGEALGCDLFALLATEFFSSDGVPLSIEDVLAEVARTGNWRGELHERRADAAPLTIMCSVTVLTEEDRGPNGFVVVNRDMTDQRREEYQALHDALTGLPNRRLLINRLYDALARAYRNRTPLAVLFLDLDGFKAVNDKYGHAAGDEVLRVTARRLTGAVRHTDTVARLGGDEFVVVLEDAGDGAAVTQVASRIIESCDELVDLDGAGVAVRPSIGIAYADLAQGADVHPEELVEAADEAMYVAKREKLGLAFSPPALPSCASQVGANA